MSAQQCDTVTASLRLAIVDEELTELVRMRFSEEIAHGNYYFESA